jgi:hypothetical protein
MINMKLCDLERERHVSQTNMKHGIPHAAREGVPCRIQFSILAFSNLTWKHKRTQTIQVKVRRMKPCVYVSSGGMK